MTASASNQDRLAAVSKVRRRHDAGDYFRWRSLPCQLKTRTLSPIAPNQSSQARPRRTDATHVKIEGARSSTRP
jgi:hypothetical protein